MSNILAITYDDAIPVTPSDTTDDPNGPFAGFYSGSGGTVRVLTARKTDRTLVGVPAGVIVPIAIRRVFSSTTTATGVLGTIAMPYKGGGQ
jgi:hypothetical protein